MKKLVKSLIAIAGLAMCTAGAGVTFAGFSTTKALSRATSVKRVLFLDLTNCSQWTEANAKFGVWLWANNGSGDLASPPPVFANNGFMEVFSPGVYRSTIPVESPVDYNQIIFVRFTPEATAPSWSAPRWAQTVDIPLSNSNNCYKMHSNPDSEGGTVYSGDWTDSYTNYSYTAS